MFQSSTSSILNDWCHTRTSPYWNCCMWSERLEIKLMNVMYRSKNHLQLNPPTFEISCISKCCFQWTSNCAAGQRSPNCEQCEQARANKLERTSLSEQARANKPERPSQCEQRTVRTIRIVQTVRITNSANGSYCPNSANSSFFRNRRIGWTDANTVQWSLLVSDFGLT